MKTINQRHLKIFTSLVLAICFLLALLGSLNAEPQGSIPFGYGFNVAEWDVSKVQAMGFNWMKVFNGPGSRLPVNILLRVDANASHLNDADDFGDAIQQLAQEQLGFVDAYEIGNEPNLDATYGWGAPPIAADYAILLCEAYGRIKTIDPDAIVVSAGLAPTGRVQGNWNGHPGHNGLYQDERQFFLEFVAAGGGSCLDVVGYHPYGYSADFDAEPDMASGDPSQNCANGFCFRGSEKLYELMQANGLGGKKMWATEYGWITDPPSHCLNNPGWQGRAWQIVSEQKQADNLVGSFAYASSNWPWMGAMFIFNLNFNEAPWLAECEQMRFYSVVGRAADAALTAMPKISPPAAGVLDINPLVVTTIITPGQQPYSQTSQIQLENSGTLPLVYTATIQAGAPFTLTFLSSSTGSLVPNQLSDLDLYLEADYLTAGNYSGSIQVASESDGVLDEESIQVKVFIWDQIWHTYLPVGTRP
jgi:hypothetical protein